MEGLAIGAGILAFVLAFGAFTLSAENRRRARAEEKSASDANNVEMEAWDKTIGAFGIDQDGNVAMYHSVDGEFVQLRLRFGDDPPMVPHEHFRIFDKAALARLMVYRWTRFVHKSSDAK